jgi:hypothetical protein
MLTSKIPVKSMSNIEQLNDHSPITRALGRELGEPVSVSDCYRSVKNLALAVNRECSLNQHTSRPFQVQGHEALGGLFIAVGIKLQ